jgi:hypothetical protein
MILFRQNLAKILPSLRLLTQTFELFCAKTWRCCFIRNGQFQLYP